MCFELRIKMKKIYLVGEKYHCFIRSPMNFPFASSHTEHRNLLPQHQNSQIFHTTDIKAQEIREQSSVLINVVCSTGC